MPQQPRSPAVTSHVVTGAARGVGRAIAEQLARTGPVVVVDLGRLDGEHPTSGRSVATPATVEARTSVAHGRLDGSIVNLRRTRPSDRFEAPSRTPTTPRW